MIQRFDQLAVDLPEPNGPNPAAAAAIQKRMDGTPSGMADDAKMLG